MDAVVCEALGAMGGGCIAPIWRFLMGSNENPAGGSAQISDNPLESFGGGDDGEAGRLQVSMGGGDAEGFSQGLSVAGTACEAARLVVSEVAGDMCGLGVQLDACRRVQVVDAALMGLFAQAEVTEGPLWGSVWTGAMVPLGAIEESDVMQPHGGVSEVMGGMRGARVDPVVYGPLA